ncbi:MAG: hypothetical protein ACXW5U_05680 [Thermoanaerobaculia bacterium]
MEPIRVVQGVATGLLGRSSFQGGIGTALLGLALHFLIATVVVCVYHVASRIIALLRRAPIAMGVFYGLLVYAFMNWVVLPLSAAGPPKLVMAVVLNGLFAHVFCEMRGLRDLGEAEDAGVERARIVFAAAGHGELDVMQSGDGHVLSAMIYQVLFIRPEKRGSDERHREYNRMCI